MIKLGERRINPGHIVQYFPVTDTHIRFVLSEGNSETVTFDSKEERDGMLDQLDKCLVSFDNGTIVMPDLSDIPIFSFGGQEPTEGPGGISMQ